MGNSCHEYSGVLPSIFEERKGELVKNLAPGTLLVLQTRSGSTYKIVLVNPARHEVMIKGPNRLVQEPKLMCLQGSTAGGCLMRSGFIGEGLQLFLSTSDTHLTTSPVTDIRRGIDPKFVAEMLDEACLQSRMIASNSD